MVDVSTFEIATKRSELETSRRQLSEDVSFGITTLSVVEQSSFENHPRGRSLTWYAANSKQVEIRTYPDILPVLFVFATN